MNDEDFYGETFQILSQFLPQSQIVLEEKDGVQEENP